MTSKTKHLTRKALFKEQCVNCTIRLGCPMHTYCNLCNAYRYTLLRKKSCACTCKPTLKERASGKCRYYEEL